MKNSMLILMFGIGIAVVSLIFWLKPSKTANSRDLTASDVQTSVNPTPHSQSALDIATSNSIAPIRFKTGLEQLPASLAGTEVDGELLIDEQKNLYVTRRLLDLFDYFLATIGEESLPTITERVNAYIKHRTPEPAQSQALALFDRYIAYRNALRDVPEAGGKPANQIDPEAILQQKATEQRLRQQFFDAKTITAFFGDEDAYDQYTLQSLKIANDPTISAAEKAKQTAELLQKLPETVRESMQDILQYQNLDQLTTQWKARNGTAAELRQIRLNLVGPEATGRLEALDQDNLQWQRRVDDYLKAYHPIMRNPQWSAEQKQLMVLGLRRQQGFSETEQLRLPAFEQMAAQTAAQPR